MSVTALASKTVSGSCNAPILPGNGHDIEAACLVQEGCLGSAEARRTWVHL